MKCALTDCSLSHCQMSILDKCPRTCGRIFERQCLLHPCPVPLLVLVAPMLLLIPYWPTVGNWFGLRMCHTIIFEVHQKHIHLDIHQGLDMCVIRSIVFKETLYFLLLTKRMSRIFQFFCCLIHLCEEFFWIGRLLLVSKQVPNQDGKRLIVLSLFANHNHVHLQNAPFVFPSFFILILGLMCSCVTGSSMMFTTTALAWSNNLQVGP